MSNIYINHYSIIHGGNETYSVGGWEETEEYVKTILLSEDVLKANVYPDRLFKVKECLFGPDWESGVDLYNHNNWHKDYITFHEYPR